MQKELRSRIDSIQLRIDEASKKILKESNEISLIAVSKRKSIEHIQHAYEIGIRNFGENYAQELEEKVKQLSYKEIVWHFIGPLQSNKAKSIATNADWIHSLDREKIVNKINSECGNVNKKINGCIQINISGETSKSGLKPEELLDFADHIKLLENINLKGIMVLPSLIGDVEEQMINSKKLHNKLIESHPEATYLSMGTTNDFESAIKFGSNMVRIGELIFGKR
ncbi:YggS family pyridoxal phosphate-dependent enzyme [Gammaproteobacteria bacterium]|jgi:pyridoxal phosphate enzyme (YggS family)|nr:YggS family pyridoxal phosphate-dependent enzyme [Gammaproteobacteria bacterium]MDA9574966.1 YggS family pyridoxal phosphate-dependent enzyme [Gammaproteobacteria bacterium]MDA9920782.1 YggS family pyridoxal phosphate-dependent enzyme [Gammaproteobacteria bacterium]MDB2447733.1 YggS family pyridoxal phosphate-dependent enzyme [Gammaproteobacteria bacterium]MDB2503335.1 YggS family pyridoxal phosphate-dependent enzyme [Gammaproteobacteria bacterium]